MRRPSDIADDYFKKIEIDNIDYIFENTESIFLGIGDQRQQILDHSSSLRKITYHRESVIGINLSEVFHAADLETLFSLEERTVLIVPVKPDETTWKCYYLRNGEEFLIVAERIKMSDNTVMNQLAGLTNQIANLGRVVQRKNRELRLANERITRLSRIDPLTQLYNRRYFYEIFDTNLAFAKRHGIPVSLVLCDIDHFKHINDTLGHDTGDEVLRKFAALLRDHCRNEDLPVRFGGEEFILLLPNSDCDSAYKTAERFRPLLEQTRILKQQVVTASFGVAEYTPGDSAETVVKNADTRLYDAKKSGRNIVTLYRREAEAPI